jgi:acyl-CoA synthetase (NDP forming)
MQPSYTCESGADSKAAPRILSVITQGTVALNESDSKALLASYGVPVVDEHIAATPDEAAKAAAGVGFPVALKALGAGLSHKTERNLVSLNLHSAKEVQAEAARMALEAGRELEGYLVQPMLPGRREFVAGLFHDKQFGPVVLFGLGGVFTEALEDAVFRLAPLSRFQAGQMLDQIKAKQLLGCFRGEAEADREALISTLMGLSRLGMEMPRVREVDINPLIIGPDGKVSAVDALAVLGEPSPPGLGRPPMDPADVGVLFHPRSVAFVGASAGFGKWGNRLITNVLAGGFEGQIHLVNPKGGSIMGRPVHKSLLDIPEPVDLAVVTIPAGFVMELLPQLEAKGIKGMLLVSSGFSETGDKGKELEKVLVQEARSRGILMMGPNTMGISNPHRKFFCTHSINRTKPGSTAFVSQSGNMGVQLLAFAEKQGIGIRAFGGSGNEAMFTIEDALDAFSVDELTDTVLLYLESVKNGRRFYESARKVSRQKPIIVLKGGRTQAGGNAAASHTGALASDHKVFKAACGQAGIILAEQPMELLDLSAAFSSAPLPKGPRVAIMTLGGGWGVVTADLCEEYRLKVPELSPGLLERIDRLLPDFWSRANPVDMVGDEDQTIPLTVLESLLAWDGCDAVIHLGIVGRKYLYFDLRDAALKVNPDLSEDFIAKADAREEEIEARFINRVARLMDQYGKPVLGVSLAKGPKDTTVVEVPGFRSKGVFYAAPEQAVKSLSRMFDYAKWRACEL